MLFSAAVFHSGGIGLGDDRMHDMMDSVFVSWCYTIRLKSLSTFICTFI